MKVQWRVNNYPAARVNGKESASCLLGTESYRSGGRRSKMWSTNLLVRSDVGKAGEREAVHGREKRALAKRQHSVAEDRIRAS